MIRFENVSVTYRDAVGIDVNSLGRAAGSAMSTSMRQRFAPKTPA